MKVNLQVQSSQQSFLDGGTPSPSQSTKEGSPTRDIVMKESQHSTQRPTNINHSKYFLAAQTKDQRYSPTFLGIPQTIRDQIYHHTFSNSLVHISRRHKSTVPCIKKCSPNHLLIWNPRQGHRRCDAYTHCESSHTLGLLSVCRSLRYEAMPFYLTFSVFHIHGPASMCADWLQTFPLEDRRMLREVRVSDPYEHLSLLAGALRKNAARESLGGVLGEIAKKGVELKVGVLKVRFIQGGKVRWKPASIMKHETGLTMKEEST